MPVIFRTFAVVQLRHSLDEEDEKFTDNSIEVGEGEGKVAPGSFATLEV